MADTIRFTKKGLEVLAERYGGVFFSREEVEAIRSDLETAYKEIGEELIDGSVYGDDLKSRMQAEKLHRKLGRIAGVTTGKE